MRRPVAALSIIVLGVALSACGSRDSGASDTAAAPSVEANASAGGDTGANTGASAYTAPIEAMGTQEFADAVAADNRFVIDISRLALEKSSSEAVKAFARTMIDTHRRSDVALAEAGAKALPAVRAAATLPDDLHIRMNALKPESGAAFDRAYLHNQIAAHEHMLAVLRYYAVGGEVEAFKDFAAETAPIAEAHLKQAQAIRL